MIKKAVLAGSLSIASAIILPLVEIALAEEMPLTIVEEGMDALSPATPCKCSCRATREQLENCGYKGDFKGLKCVTVSKGSPVSDPCKGRSQNACTSGKCTISIQDKNGVSACAIGHHGFENSCELKKAETTRPAESSADF